MIQPREFYDSLKRRGVGLFAGVPDSLLAPLCATITASATREGEHIIAANEGNAIGIAAGYHLSSGKLGVVYMQNSGLGNCVNPLASLTDPEVYRIPMLLIVGWRGEPGVKDEPQHVKQGKITEGQLELLGIPFWRLNAKSNPEEILDKAFDALREKSAPVAILVQKGTFVEPKGSGESTRSNLSPMTRESAINAICASVGASDLLVSTTGKTSRELFEVRKARGESQRDFLTVGSMGHTLSIALGVALGNTKKRVVCLDGDGSLLMHMGALPVTAAVHPKNLTHILLNNGAHESVGGQPTIADRVDFQKLATACGYTRYFRADSLETLDHVLSEARKADGPLLVEVRVALGSRADLGRPTSTPEQNKMSFIEAARG
jgi:phosphonopyruvate decarboxylase